MLTALEAIPGALLGIAAVYFYGARQGNEPLSVPSVALGAAAVALALGAAVLHAVWNLLLAGADDTDAATALALADRRAAVRRPRRARDLGRRRGGVAVHRGVGGVRARLRRSRSPPASGAVT